MYSDIRQFIEDIKNNWQAVSERFQFASSKFFYRESFVSLVLFNKSYQNLPKDGFINYAAAFLHYAKNHQKWTLVKDGEEREIDVPYQDLVNFIDEPEAKIIIDGPIEEFVLDEQVRNDTDQAFEEFIQERPRTTNGPLLRLADLSKNDQNNYVAKLQRAGYFDSVRTNISLDHQLDSDTFRSMRIDELDDEGNLIPIGKSKMANGIGVSSVLAFQSQGVWYFHMQPRTSKLGVFTNMLSSVGGVAEPPAEPTTDLVEYLTKEIKRELQEETGLDIEEIQHHSRFNIVPLALTRELTRGGKPEFFFLTVMGELDEKEFSQVFRNAKWKGEFKTDFFSNISSFDDVLSPGFATNLMYALRYMQTRQKIQDSRLILPS